MERFAGSHALSVTTPQLFVRSWTIWLIGLLAVGLASTPLMAQPAFTENVATAAGDGPLSVFAVDFDGDGDTDLISSSFFDNLVRWYENDGADPPTFTPHDVFTGTASHRSVFAADIDSDGDIDILSASFDDDTVWFHENDGSSRPNFTAHAVARMGFRKTRQTLARNALSN